MSAPAVDMLDRCSGCGHSLDRHFRAGSGRVVCLVSESGVSTRGVIGLPWSSSCDCIDGHSPRADARRAHEEAERKKMDWLADEIRAAMETTIPENAP